VGQQATGNFQATPFPQVLVFLRRRAMTGTLSIEGEDGTDAGKVFFIEGRPAFIAVQAASDRLGELLVIRGTINAKALAGALRGMKERGVRLGRYLLDEGLLEEEDLGDVMAFQLARRLKILYPLASERFTFHEGQNLVNFPAQDMHAIDPVPSMPRHLSDTWELSRLETQLSVLEGRGLSFKTTIDGGPEWSDPEQALLRTLEGRTLALDQALDEGSGQEPAMQVVLYVLMLNGGIDLVDAPAAAAASPPVRSGPPAQASGKAPAAAADPRQREMRQTAREKVAQIKEGNFFAMLEASEESDVETIRSAYLRLIKKFHPDSASSVNDEKLHQSHLFISTKLREAFDALTDPERKQAHLVKLRGGPTQEQEQAIVQKALSAEMSFQKAGILARKRKWSETASLMIAVLQAAPDNGDYLALLAWAEVNLKKSGEDLTEQEANLRKAVSMAPKSEKANYYLANVLKRSGKDREARTYLESVVRLNPYNIDAKRELRILSMRQEQPARSSSLLQNLGGERGKEKGGRDEKKPQGALGKLKKMLTRKL